MLTIIWWAAAVSGGAVLLVAVVLPARRKEALLGGAVLFGVAGVLGILSIGIVFLLLAAACLRVASRAA
jgi:hypothetical protein